MKSVRVNLHNHLINPRNRITEGIQRISLKKIIEESFKHDIDFLAVTEFANEPDPTAPFRYISNGFFDNEIDYRKQYDTFAVLKRGEQRLYSLSGIEIPVMFDVHGETKEGDFILIGFDPAKLDIIQREDFKYSDTDKREAWDRVVGYMANNPYFLSYVPHPGDEHSGLGNDATIWLMEQGYADTYEAFNSAFERVDPAVNERSKNLEDITKVKGIVGNDCILPPGRKGSYLAVNVDQQGLNDEEFVSYIRDKIIDGNFEAIENPISFFQLLAKAAYSKDKMKRLKAKVGIQ